MSLDTFTAILNAAEFPFVSNFLNRSVIIPGLDNPVRTPKEFYGSYESANFELAQVYYGQNILPTTQGISSCSYRQVIPAYGTPVTDFDQAMVLRDEDENNFIFSPANGKNYIYTANSGVWTPTNSFLGWAGTLVSRAYVNGRTFICYERQNVYEYNTAAATFLPVGITGLTAADIDCIGSSNNYLLAASGIIVYWSSLIAPTDFTASIQTGAGFAIPQDVKGVIRAIIPIAGGFIIYTTKNAVAALYTNNVRAPFIFREISNAGGVQGPEQISLEASLGFHYAWTTNGLQKISLSSAETLSAGAADFLGGRIYESFDVPTLTWTIKRLSADLKVKLTYISGRFLVISYGEASSPQLYTHALVYDLGLKRWGKLRVDHVDCFAYPYPNLISQVTDTPPKQSVAFLKSSGQIDLLIQDFRERSDQGVLMLGRYQVSRGRNITFQGVELEGVHQAYPPSIYLILSMDGINNNTPQLLTQVYNGNQIKRYGRPAPSGNVAAPCAGVNFSLLAVGTFDLSTAVFSVTRGALR